MATLTFKHLREVNVARCVHSFGHALEAWSVPDWMVALGGEVGEALNVIKKLNRERDFIVGNTKTGDELRLDLGDELADAVIYLDLLLAREGLSYRFDLDFELLRDDSKRNVEWNQTNGTAVALSDYGFEALLSIGRLGKSLRDGGTVLRDALSLLMALAAIAEVADIDLGAAVVRKFNATSEKRGAAERLAP